MPQPAPGSAWAGSKRSADKLQTPNSKLEPEPEPESEPIIMIAMLLPMLGEFVWVGGGSAGLILLILLLVLLLR